MLEVNDQIRISDSEFHWSYVRSSGPGGQNVNKVASKAVLRWDLAASKAVPDEVKARFRGQQRRRITTEGELVLSSQRFRDQERNRQDCLDKLRDLLLQAAARPRVRKPTRPSRGSKAARLEISAGARQPRPGDNGRGKSESSRKAIGQSFQSGLRFRRGSHAGRPIGQALEQLLGGGIADLLQQPYPVEGQQPVRGDGNIDNRKQAFDTEQNFQRRPAGDLGAEWLDCPTAQGFQCLRRLLSDGKAIAVQVGDQLRDAFRVGFRRPQRVAPHTQRLSWPGRQRAQGKVTAGSGFIHQATTQSGEVPMRKGNVGNNGGWRGRVPELHRAAAAQGGDHPAIRRKGHP